MNILLAGNFKYNLEHINYLEKMGFKLFFLEKESDRLPLEAATIDVVVCNWLFVYHDITDFKRLKYIQLLSAGVDRVPVKYITEHGIELHNARGVYSIPMAEYAVCGVLQLIKHTRFFAENQNKRKWVKDRGLLELSDRTIGIVGFGSVGQEVAKKFSSFTNKIMGFDIYDSICSEYDVFNVDKLDDMLKDIDVLIFTVPITDKTKGYFNYSRMSKMPQNSIIVNISRGGVVVEKDVVKAISDGILLGAVLDVFDGEPLTNDELWDCKNIIITPHNSFVSNRNDERMWNVIIDNLSGYIG